MISTQTLNHLDSRLDGELYYDDLMKTLYATDASVYRILPLAVAYPKHKKDIRILINFAVEHSTSLIPRTAGTSLAGQCVGEGIVVDVSKYFTKILDVNENEQTVTVEPGVIRDELNAYLEPFGLFFGPNTSTTNRCMIGGMVGNNSSGTTSIQYGVTRDKVIELQTLLSDGSEATFKAISKEEFNEKQKLNSLEGHIYNRVYETLKPSYIQNEITDRFPKPTIHRRNTGYAIDELINTNILSKSDSNFNLCKLLAGSEGTLAFTTQIKLKLDKLPPKNSVMLAAHFTSIKDCLEAVVPVMKHKLFSCEMMDKTILDLTKYNKTQQANRSFIEGDPEAILMLELKADSNEHLNELTEDLISTIRSSSKAYAFPLLYDSDITKASELRKAGLGLLGNIVGDKKAVACIEDTAVAISDLSQYISEFTEIMEKHAQKAVYYAHAGAGELHLRPILNLKNADDIKLFKTITTQVAHLVKKYQGSMSGEHGDGIVRAEFIPLMIGENNYEILKQIKSTFDPNNIFNPGKIVDALPMDKSLRFDPELKTPEFDTILDFSSAQGILREAEKCNGSGDCRKLPESGGAMCPSYRATRNEKDTTRARANALREFLTRSGKQNRFDHEELKAVFDLCLSCKACSSECPSSVDIASLKAEFQYQYRKSNSTSFRDKFFANAVKHNQRAAIFAGFSNALFKNKLSSNLIKSIIGIHKDRSLPHITKPQYKFNDRAVSASNTTHPVIKTVILFIDEFINYNEYEIAVDTYTLLLKLNYRTIIINNLQSGRSFISKGFLDEAKSITNSNLIRLNELYDQDLEIIGIEPSAILTLRDEYMRLADDKTLAKQTADRTFLIEEFIQKEIQLGHISADQFTSESKQIKFHGHCHQKALSNQSSSFDMLNLPENYSVTIIPSGCCGMAGSFGFEKEHYDVSMNIGEQTLFPAIRNSANDVIISANGTSCRHQILDGTEVKAIHPVTILKEALLV